MILWNAKLRMKWIGSYTIVRITAVGEYNLKEKCGHCLKIHFPPRKGKQYYQGILAGYDDEDLLSHSYICPEVIRCGKVYGTVW